MLTNQHWCFSKGALTVIALRNVSSRARHLNRMNKIGSMDTCAHPLAQFNPIPSSRSSCQRDSFCTDARDKFAKQGKLVATNSRSCMDERHIETERLRLVPYQPKEMLIAIEAMDPGEAKEISPEWLARLRQATHPDPWAFGFAFQDRSSGAAIGMGGFKGPPGKDGLVEVAYGVNPEHRKKGYATEATRALVAFAFDSGKVRRVIAHTLPQANPSTRVLTKCGFRFVGDVIDPEDGPVWRWEKDKEG